MHALRDLLRAEIEALLPDLDEAIGRLCAEGEAGSEGYLIYGELLSRMAEVAEMTELRGMHQCCNQILLNLHLLAAEHHAPPPTLVELLKTWPQLLITYLSSPNEHSNQQALLQLLVNQNWPMPLNNGDIDTLAAALQNIPKDHDDAQTELRPHTALVADVDLQVDPLINPQVYEAFLHEAPIQLAAMSQHLQAYLVHQEPTHIQAAQRETHTLKGAAATAGVAGIMNIAHQLEDIFEYLAEKHLAVPEQIASTLIQASDCMAEMLDYLCGNAAAPADSLTILQKLLDLAHLVDQDQLDFTAAVTANTLVAEAAEPVNIAESPASLKPSVRVSVDDLTELLATTGELSVLSEHMKEQLKLAFHRITLLSRQNEQLASQVHALETLIDIKAVPFLEPRLDGDTHAAFDPLEMDQYHELHGYTRSFGEAITDSRELNQILKQELRTLESLLREQSELHKDLQKSIQNTRMVPVKSMSARLQRSVRQACRDTGKDVELIIRGEDILLDSEVLNRVADPLMHILRNAVDHGIEAADIRATAGKSAQGKIALNFKREGNQMVIDCQDDGGGLNTDAIRTAAIKRGLINQDTNLSQHELQHLILRAGFSSRDQVTTLSGRGVGLDVVQQALLDMKGSIDIVSTTGHGLLLRLRIPITLISLNLLFVDVAGEIYALPSALVIKPLASGSGQLQAFGENYLYQTSEDTYPAVLLGDLLHLGAHEFFTVDARSKPAVLIRSETGPQALLVDRIHFNRDNVLKNFGQYLPKVHGIAGAVVMGNGDIVPVLELSELLREPVTLFRPEKSQPTSPTLAPEARNILVVEDSLSARRALAQVLSDAGYQVETATDGIDALKHLEKFNPGVILTDLEMPRMNGLELTAQLRKRAKTSATPIIMITSRHTDKHRQLAINAGVTHYLTKPYGESELLQQVKQSLRPLRQQAITA